MSTHADRIIEYLRQFPGRDDDEIASALTIRPRQTVNIVCRKLESKGLLRRQYGSRGKIVNYLAGAGEAFVRATRASASAVMTEDEVKGHLKNMLEGAGWTVEVAWGRARGVDITATRDGKEWVIECKGSGSTAPMQNNYFLGAIGELLQRMHKHREKHSVAFPDVPKFRRLWSELPAKVKEGLALSALFVASDGSVHEDR